MIMYIDKISYIRIILTILGYYVAYVYIYMYNVMIHRIGITKVGYQNIDY